jgi:RNA polymerase sigma-70 factor (ECF subfamily)
VAAETMTLVHRAADGDDDAFRRLVALVHEDLRRWALARMADPDDADEVVQRTLIRMHRSLHRFDGRSRLSTWLYRILHNAAVDLERHRRARPPVPDRCPAGDLDRAERPDPARALESRRLWREVMASFAALPPRQREVLELVDHQGRRPVEVAEMLDMKAVTVRANLFKARRAVREAILARHPELEEGYET